MVWGGSLNKKGSNHIRKLKEAEKIVVYLENIKEGLNNEEKENISRAIEIISAQITKFSEETD